MTWFNTTRDAILLPVLAVFPSGPGGDWLPRPEEGRPSLPAHRRTCFWGWISPNAVHFRPL